MGAVAVEDGFEQSSRGDYSGRALGRSSKISEKPFLFNTFRFASSATQKSADVRSHQRIFCLQQGPQPPGNAPNRCIVILGYMV